MRKCLSRLIPAALAALALSACGRAPASGLDREVFEQVMVDLRRAELETDSAGFEVRRDAILKAAGVADSLLLGFVRAHASDLEYMVDVWESIDRRVNGSVGGEAAVDTLSRR